MAHLAHIESPLGEDLLLHRAVAREQLGRLYSIRLELHSKRFDIAFKDLIGQSMTVHLALPAGGTRQWNGIVADFAYVGSHGRYAAYAATLRPKLWLLNHRTNCRIFQEVSVPDIASEILKEHGISDVEVSLSETYSPREYCVQYRESDFAFISRLFEQVGIYYFFVHEGGKHKLVLIDGPSAHKPAPSPYAEVPFRIITNQKAQVIEAAIGWTVSESLEPGSVVLDDFDFVTPKTDLMVRRVSRHVLAKAEHEIYDYPGAYVKKGDGELLVRVGLDNLYARQAVARGAGAIYGIHVGSTFKLVDHPRTDQNRKYLTIESVCEISGINHESGASGEQQVSCEFAVIDAERQYRPERVTPKPFVHGPQTAVVVGKSGEEIWTDEHGRVKLKFHWDRNTKNDESVSCWVRVAQLWAGSGFGGLHVPRMGQEVVVEFLEGDPDRPLVTGRLYNGDNRSPFPLPANADHSGIKSRSTKGGAAEHANELRFEDTKDKERILFHAQKDLVVEVEHDENDTIDHDRTTLVKNDEKVTVEGNRTEEVKKDEKITIVGNRTEEVKKDETITIKGEQSTKLEKSWTTEVSKDVKLTIKGQRTTDITMSDSLKVQELTIDSKTKIVLKTPGGSITLGPTGLEIKALMIKIEADTQCELGGKVMTKVKSTGPTSVEGLAVDVKGTTMVSVSGLMVKVG